MSEKKPLIKSLVKFQNWKKTLFKKNRNIFKNTKKI